MDIDVASQGILNNFLLYMKLDLNFQYNFFFSRRSNKENNIYLFTF